MFDSEKMIGKEKIGGKKKMWKRKKTPRTFASSLNSMFICKEEWSLNLKNCQFLSDLKEILEVY